MFKILTLLLLSTLSFSQTTQKLSNLPLGNGATTHASDSFPYTDSNAFNATKRLLLWDIINTPPFAALGGPNITVRTVAASGPILVTDNVLLVDATAGAITITALTSAAMIVSGKSIVSTVKKIDATANAVIVTAQGGDTLDGSFIRNLTTQYQTMDIFSSGGNLYVK